MEFINQLLQNPILNGLGFLLGIISLFLGYIFYREGLRLKKPLWNIKSNNLVRDYSSFIADLKILYKEEKVENFTISKIIFWNGGKDTINISDIAGTDPLKITINEKYNLLDAQILSTNNNPSQFSVSLQPDKKSALLNFEYIDYNQGVIIQITHTGTSSKDINISGTVKGAKLLKQYLVPPNRLPLPTSRETDEFILKRFSPSTRRKIISAVSFLVIISTFISLFFLFTTWGSSNNSGWVMATILFGLCSLLAIMYTANKQSQIPSGLEIFTDEIL